MQLRLAWDGGVCVGGNLGERKDAVDEWTSGLASSRRHPLAPSPTPSPTPREPLALGPLPAIGLCLAFFSSPRHFAAFSGHATRHASSHESAPCATRHAGCFFSGCCCERSGVNLGLELFAVYCWRAHMLLLSANVSY
jgi:hypothetical protein